MAHYIKKKILIVKKVNLVVQALIFVYRKNGNATVMPTVQMALMKRIVPNKLNVMVSNVKQQVNVYLRNGDVIIILIVQMVCVFYNLVAYS